jgi:hypothetical protein
VTKEHFRNVSITHNYAFSNSLLNQAEIGYHRQWSSDTQQEVFSYPQIGVKSYGPFTVSPRSTPPASRPWGEMDKISYWPRTRTFCRTRWRGKRDTIPSGLAAE